MEAKLHIPKGKQPRPPFKAPKFGLSVSKGSEVPETARRFA